MASEVKQANTYTTLVHPLTRLSMQTHSVTKCFIIITQGNKLWGGRFSGDVDPEMNKFNASIGFDKRMWKEDIMVILFSNPKRGSKSVTFLISSSFGKQVSEGLSLSVSERVS